jgi:Protein of unknown function (DUF2721)
LTEPLQIVATAITPVVMVSSTAILAGGINSRYMTIADRIRTLAREYRDTQTPEPRRVVISKQMVVFQRRVSLVSSAIRMCYVAMACFILMALVITATAFREMLVAVTLPLFLIGIGLLLTAIFFQLLELQAANLTIAMEVKDVLHGGQLD